MLPIASSAFQLCSGALSVITAPMNSALGLLNNGAVSRYVPPVVRAATAASLLGCSGEEVVMGMFIAVPLGVMALWTLGQRLI